MVGAGASDRIYAQMNGYPIDIVGNYGMQESKIIDGKFQIIREEKMFVDKDFFCEKIKYLREKYGYNEFKGDGVEFHATGMVTFPLLGTKADICDKVAFDPTREKRKVLYPEILEIFKDYTVYIGGSSSFDFSAKNYNKYDAIMRYANENGYMPDEILYVGDDFGDGGGDSHVRLGGLDYVEITDYQTIEERLTYLLE
jgi:hydroxymethylpyrimidine pyrophosphatase-like HAD family hydrolase